MKITLKSNSQFDLPENLKNLDVSQGMTFYHPEKQQMVEPKSWMNRVLNMANRVLGTPEPEQDFARNITKAVDYVNNNLKPHGIENIAVQLNLNTAAHDKVKNAISAMRFHFNVPVPQIAYGLNTQEGVMRIIGESKNSTITIGSNYFSDSLEFGQNFKQAVGKSRVDEFVFFHELGHAIDFNAPNDNYDSTFFSTLARIENLSKLGVHKLNDDVKKQGFLNPIEQTLVNNLECVRREIYADVTAMLLMRNYDIENGVYDKNNTDKFLQSLIKFRQDEQVYSEQNKHYINFKDNQNFDHLTVTGLENLMDKIENKTQGKTDMVLSEQDMNMIAQASVAEGLARLIITTNAMDNDIQGQYNTLFRTHFNGNTGNLELDLNYSSEHYNNMISSMEKLAGNAWVERFNQNLNHLGDVGFGHHMTDREYMSHIFDIGVRPETFHENMDNIAQLNSDISDANNNQAFAENDSSSVKTPFEVNDKIVLIKKISAMREEAYPSHAPELKHPSI